MQEVITFLNQHWILSGLFALVALLLILNEARAGGSSDSQVDPHKAVELINHQDAVVIDLRSSNQFLDGHIVGALNITKANLESKLNSLQRHIDKPIILVATEEAEASKVLPLLKSKGFKVTILAGGLKAWRAASMPLTKKS